MVTLLSATKRGFSELLRRYPMQVTVENASRPLTQPGTIILESNCCRLNIAFELGYPIIRITDTKGGRTFPVLLFVAMQNPRYEMTHSFFLQYPEDDIEVVRVLRAIEGMVLTYCQSMFEGFFDPAEIEQYDDFCASIEATSQVLRSLPESDPIKLKSRQNDYSWVSDLRARLDLDGPDTTKRKK